MVERNQTADQSLQGDNNPSEASYRHLLKTPQHYFPLELEDSACDECVDIPVRMAAELRAWSLGDALEK